MLRLRTFTPCLLLLACSALQAAGDQLVLHGSNTIGEHLAPNLVQAWLERRGCERIERSSLGVDQLRISADCETQPMQVDIHALGTGTGFAELKSGRADLWMASRPVSASELAQAGATLPLQEARHEHVIALDGLSVIVHPRNTLPALSLAQVRDIFGGTLSNWRSVGGPDAPIRVHARDDRSGSWDSFKAMALAGAALSTQARRYESSEELSAAVAADPAAIGFVGLGAVGASRALPIADGAARAMAPAAAQVATEDYALARRLFLYSGASVRPLAQELLAFCVSDAGQQVVERTGFVGLAVRPVDLPVAKVSGQAGLDYQDVAGAGQRLGVNFRFSERTAALDTRGQTDVQRLVDFMRRPENQGRSLRLAGFADASETAYGALVLSTDRADFVAAMLNRAGIPVSRVRGLGQALPVADNAHVGGRARNRRVEVWIDADQTLGKAPPADAASASALGS